MLAVLLISCVGAQDHRSAIALAPRAELVQGLPGSGLGTNLATWRPPGASADWLVIASLSEASVGDVPGDLWVLDASASGRVDRLASEVLRGPAGSRAGVGLTGAGDLDGDGLADLLIGAPLDSSVRPLGGSLSWLSDPTGQTTTGAGLLYGDGYAMLGGALHAADLDLDGAPELIAGLPQGDGAASNGGGVLIWRGPVTPGSDADLRLDRNREEEHAGETFASGDLWGDSLLELVVGAPRARGGDGAVFVVGASETQRLRDLDRIRGPKDSGFGTALLVADIDKDGDDDLVVGAPDAAGGWGRVFVFLGPITTPMSAAEADWRITGQAIGDGFGASLLWLPTQGRLLVGAPLRRGAGGLYAFDPDTRASSAGRADSILMGHVDGALAGSALLLWDSIDGEVVAIAAPGLDPEKRRGGVYLMDPGEAQ